MAYMNQERKQQIAAELKKVMPKDWKYSLSVKQGSRTPRPGSRFGSERR